MAGRVLLLVCAFLLVGAGRGDAQTRSTELAAQRVPGGRSSRDETLWKEISALNRVEPATGPFSDYLASVQRRRRALLEKVQAYLLAYPGGARRDDAVRIELRTLFEIGTLSGGQYEALAERVEEYMRHPPSRVALYEAAYWRIQLGRLEREAEVSDPMSAAIARQDSRLLSEYREYIERYPASPYVPRMATALFGAAFGRGDRGELRWLVDRLERDFPGHAVTELLGAQLRRLEALGQPFSLTFEAADGKRVDTAAWKGQPVLIVVWAGFDERARACVREIAAFQREHPELRVVGVNLDESTERMNALCRELGLSWPQFNDGMGWANRFARRWGVRQVPRVFVANRDGCLAGTSGADGWRELAAGILEN